MPPASPLKVVHAAETIKGGIATVMRTLLADQIATFGPGNVTALVPDAHTDELSPLPPEIIQTFRRSGRNPGSFLRFTIRFCSLVLKRRPQVVHLHSTFAGFLGRYCLLLLRPFIRPQVVYCPHAFAFLMASSRARREFCQLMERLLASFTDAVICVSRYELEQAKAAGLSEPKLKLVYNGFPQLAEDSPNPFPDTNRINALFVGRLDYQKGFDVLYKAFTTANLPNVHLTVIGNTVVGNQTETFSPNPSISFLGWKKPEETKTYLEHADVVIVPSRWEGFAMVPLEAMSAATAVVSSTACSLPEQVIDGQTGYTFNLNDPTRLIEILRTSTRERWQKLGQAARTRHETEFTAAAMCSQTRNLYPRMTRHDSLQRPHP